MKLESLLKSISSIIKKNEKFFIDNPEIFTAVYERFNKAAYDDDQDEDTGYGDIWGAMQDKEMGLDPQDEEQQDPEDEDYDYASGEKDPEQDGEEDGQDEGYQTKYSDDEEDAAQEKLLAQLQAQKDKKQAAQPAKSAEPAQPAKQQPAKAEPQERSVPTGSGQWQPKSKYAPHHAEAMKQFIDQGFSPREAERMADAHDKLTLDQAIKSGISPTHPSRKMLDMMKDLAGKWHADVTHKIGLSANPEENPELNFNSVKNQTTNNVFDAMNNATENYKKTISHVKDPKQLTNMLTDFQHQWLQNNQHFFNDLHNATEKVSQTATANKQARENRRKEGQMAIIGATKVSGEDAPSATGDVSGIEGGAANKEAIKQSAGGFKADEEGPTQVSTVQDPAFTLATKNPEYVKQQTIKFGEKYKDKMTPEQQQRFQEIKSKKTPTGNS